MLKKDRDAIDSFDNLQSYKLLCAVKSLKQTKKLVV